MTQLHCGYRSTVFLVIAALLLGSACMLLPSPPEPPPPEPENQPPVIHSITAEREVTASTECQISCEATDVNSATLNYWWSANGGMIEGEGNSITWIAPDIAGDYTIKVMVTDGNGGEAIDSVTVTVTAKPNQTPTITTLEVTLPNKSPITIDQTGKLIRTSRYDTAEIECIGEDPDGDELSFTWSATGGKIQGEGDKVGWTAPSVAGNYTVTVTVTDGRGGEAEASMQFDVLCCGR